MTNTNQHQPAQLRNSKKILQIILDTHYEWLTSHIASCFVRNSVEFVKHVDQMLQRHLLFRNTLEERLTTDERSCAAGEAFLNLTGQNNVIYLTDTNNNLWFFGSESAEIIFFSRNLSRRRILDMCLVWQPFWQQSSAPVSTTIHKTQRQELPLSHAFKNACTHCVISFKSKRSEDCIKRIMYIGWIIYISCHFVCYLFFFW